MKMCTKCQVTQNKTCFNKDKNRRDGLFPHCKGCVKAYRQSDRGSELHRLANQRHQKTPKGRATLARCERRYQQTESGRLMYQQAARRRLERKRGIDMQFSDADMKAVHQRFKHQCFNCGCSDHLQIDHNYPLSLGYGLTPFNAVLLCRSCNASKSDKLPYEFYSEHRLIRLEAILSSL